MGYKSIPDGILIEFDDGHKKYFLLIWSGQLQFCADMTASVLWHGEYVKMIMCASIVQTF